MLQGGLSGLSIIARKRQTNQKRRTNRAGHGEGAGRERWRGRAGENDGERRQADRPTTSITQGTPGGGGGAAHEGEGGRCAGGRGAPGTRRGRRRRRRAPTPAPRPCRSRRRCSRGPRPPAAPAPPRAAHRSPRSAGPRPSGALLYRRARDDLGAAPATASNPLILESSNPALGQARPVRAGAHAGGAGRGGRTTPRKSRSASLPGNCRTAKRSIHTIRPRFAPHDAAATRLDHFPPQQWLRAAPGVSPPAPRARQGCGAACLCAGASAARPGGGAFTRA